MALTKSSSCRNWKSGSNPKTSGTRLPAQEGGERAVAARAERVAKAEDGRRQLREAPERRRRVEVGGDEIGELGKAIELQRRLVFRVKERRVRPRAVEGVAADEDAVLDAVGAARIEDGARAAEVDLRSRSSPGTTSDVTVAMCTTTCGRTLAEHVLGGALADVDRVELDGRVGPRAAVDPDDLVTFVAQAERRACARWRRPRRG